ncbi:MAG TPA: alginate lyase family protein [Geminicoccaceae bacterium]|nr:alginate lyase family protein [Geminicoccaceae bacterium]
MPHQIGIIFRGRQTPRPNPRRLFALAAACWLPLLLAPPPAAAAAGRPIEAYRVTRPGLVLFDPEARAETLAGMPEGRRRALCEAGFERWPVHKPVKKVAAPKDYGGDVRSEPFAWTVMNAAAAAFGLDDGDAREALIANLERWAKGDALTRLGNRRPDTYYSLDRTLLPTIVAYGLVREHPDLEKARQKRIHSWLKHLVRMRGVKRDDDTTGPITDSNNHRYLRDGVTMAWGALVGDDDRFREGIEGYLAALADMRRDGSLPLETMRGARALWYQRHAIASLVAIAEMAAVQGYDLYGVEIEGRSLHRAIRFLVDGIADQTIVWPYAEANQSPGPFENYRVQDLSFLAPRGHGRHYMAWIEAYAARFPDRPESRSLRRQLDEFEPNRRPMIDEYSGGNTSCFFAPPDDGP